MDNDVMKTGDRTVGSAKLRVCQTQAVPMRMRVRVREVTSLEVPAAEQNKGYATTLMHRVCREADNANVVLVLWPRAFNSGLSTKQLIEWYRERFGFQCIQPEPYLMARLPGATPRLLALNPISAALFKEKTKS